MDIRHAFDGLHVHVSPDASALLVSLGMVLLLFALAVAASLIAPWS
jgi:hypothetical protein